MLRRKSSARYPRLGESGYSVAYWTLSPLRRVRVRKSRRPSLWVRAIPENTAVLLAEWREEISTQLDILPLSDYCFVLEKQSLTQLSRLLEGGFTRDAKLTYLTLGNLMESLGRELHEGAAYRNTFMEGEVTLVEKSLKPSRRLPRRISWLKRSREIRTEEELESWQEKIEGRESVSLSSNGLAGFWKILSCLTIGLAGRIEGEFGGNRMESQELDGIEFFGAFHQLMADIYERPWEVRPREGD